MAEMNGVFKGDGMVLTIMPEVKKYDDIVDGMGRVGGGASGLLSLFNRAASGSSGKAIIQKGEVLVDLKYDFTKNIVTLIDSDGTRLQFCYMNDKLYFLNPESIETTTVLSR
jgi:hypothetical protein